MIRRRRRRRRRSCPVVLKISLRKDVHRGYQIKSLFLKFSLHISLLTVHGIVTPVRYFTGAKRCKEAPRRSRQLSRSSPEIPSFDFVVSDHSSFQLKLIDIFIVFRQHVPVN